MQNELFILGSSSPRRRELLEKLGVSFKIISPQIEEKRLFEEPPWDFVKRISMEKLEFIKAHLKENLPILTADTVVAIENEILGKPTSADEAKEMLRKLSGKWHRVYTGYALLCGKKLYRRSVKSKVKIINLSDEIINWYVSTGEPLDKAGSYAIQGIGSFMVEMIRGSYTNVVGLPLSQVFNDMIKCGLIYF